MTLVTTDEAFNRAMSRAARIEDRGEYEAEPQVRHTSERLLAPPIERSTVIEEIDRRIDRLKIKRSRSNRSEVNKRNGASPAHKENGLGSKYRVSPPKDDEIPYLRAFAAFGARDFKSAINADDFERGMRTLDTNIPIKTVNEIYELYDTSQAGSLKLYAFQRFCSDIELVEGVRESGRLSMSYTHQALRSIVSRIRRKALASKERTGIEKPSLGYSKLDFPAAESEIKQAGE